MTKSCNRFDLQAPIINDSLVDHHCFGCGDLNPIGLQLRFRRLVDRSGIWAVFTPDRKHEGYLGMTHGGILSTILDEAMSWAITDRGDIGVTGRMSVSFRNPAQVGQELRVIGQVTSKRRRMIETEAELHDVGSGSLIAEAEAKFMRVTEAQAAAWRDGYGAAEGSVFERSATRGNQT